MNLMNMVNIINLRNMINIKETMRKFRKKTTNKEENIKTMKMNDDIEMRAKRKI